MRSKTYAKVACVGMDVHYQFSAVTMRDAGGQVVCRERLEHRDRTALRARLGRWPKDVPFIMEASFGWPWLADELLAAGLRPQLANCYKVEQLRKSRGWAKTNTKDADLLSLLSAEKEEWWRVWLAPPAVRDRRERLRYRTGLVRIQTQTKNRISALCHRQGIFHEFSDLFGVHGRAFLAELCREGKHVGGQLLPGALAGLGSHLRLLTHVRKQLADVTRALRRELEATPLVRRLDGIPGLGLILAHTLWSEIGELERFRNHRALALYSRLAPLSDDTGEEDPTRTPRGRHLSRRGNATLQWAFIEAAHGAVRKGGRWRRLFDAVTDGGQRDRSRGYIKVARELVKIAYVVWRKGVEYTDTRPARPGHTPRAQLEDFLGSTRPGTGQSCSPMAAVAP